LQLFILFHKVELKFEHPWDWTGARLSNILHDQTVPILTYVFTGNFFVTPQQAIRECALVSYFHFIIKRFNFSIILGPFTAFP